MKVKNREAGNKIEYHPFKGKTTEREFEYHWDLVPPYHNLAQGIDNPQFLTVPDLTESVSSSVQCYILSYQNFIMPPLKKGGHIALLLSVCFSVCRLVGPPFPFNFLAELAHTEMKFVFRFIIMIS